MANLVLHLYNYQDVVLVQSYNYIIFGIGALLFLLFCVYSIMVLLIFFFSPGGGNCPRCDTGYMVTRRYKF